jgi:hypothetical protein
VREKAVLGEDGASRSLPEPTRATTGITVLVTAAITMCWLSLCAAQSWGMGLFVVDMLDCADLTRTPTSARITLALCSVGALILAAFGGAIVNVSARFALKARALEVPIAFLVLMGLLVMWPISAFIFGWWSESADDSDLLRGYVLAGVLALPQLAAALSLLAAYFWSPQTKSRSLAMLWPLAAWSGTVVAYLAVTASAQLAHC